MNLLKTRQLLATWGVALLCGAFGGSIAGAAILYDGFDYPLGNLAGNNGGVGWAPNNILGDGAWDVFVDAGLTGSATVASTSLSLSTFPTVGNRMRIETTASTDFSVAKVVRPFRSINTQVLSGELWQSFLWRRVDDTEFNGEGELDGMQSEIRNNGPPIHFRVRPKRQNIDGVGLRYDGQISTPPGEIEDFVVNNGDTYLFIMRFTNLGTTDMSGRATMWVLNAADYDAIEAGGNLTINRTLLAEAPSTAANLPNGLRMLPGQNYRLFNSYQDLAAFHGRPFITEWDELRWGTKIGDVVPGWGRAEIVPEPGACLLAGLGGLLLAGIGRRKR